MVSALALTDRDRWYEDYSITIYQQGWRLGGKGASGRNEQEHHRIEEHGLHMWWGFYDQAFAVMQKCQEILGDESVAIDRLFSAQSSIGFIETIDGKTYQKLVTFPRNEDTLGGQPRTFGVHDYARGLARFCEHLSDSLNEDTLLKVLPDSYGPLIRLGIHRRLLRQLASVFAAFSATQAADGVGTSFLSSIARVFTGIIAADPPTTEQEESELATGKTPAVQRVLIGMLKRLRTSLRHPEQVLTPADFDVRWYFVWLDFLLTAACGLLQDRALEEWPHFQSLDEEELSHWLVRHGANQEITLSSALIRGLYDAAFCFVGGSTSQPSVSTAVIIRVFLRMFLCYKGSYMWRMNGGMGDVIFGTIYRALQKRNEEATRRSGRNDSVRVEFFHKVEGLHLSDDRSAIQSIQVARQATVRQGDYRPLTNIANCPIPVWSTEPDYDQLVEGAALRSYREKHRSTCPLESHFSDWQPVERRVLVRGKDFDWVVLAIPIAGLPYVASELIADSRRWADMVSQVKTIRTQAAQIWLARTPHQLGFCSPDLSVVAGYVDPLNSLADMSHTLPFEGWSAVEPAKSVIYFCGPMPDDALEPESTDPDYPATQVALTRKLLTDTLRSHADKLWPKSQHPMTGEFDWELLCAPASLRAADRVQAQYVRANIDPSERYVLAVPGSAKYRIEPGDSGFDNLVLAGDWTKTELSFGCIEAATQSGQLAASALSAKQASLRTQQSHRARSGVTLPMYRRPFAEQVFRPPYLLQGATFHTHVLAAKEALLRRVCDHYLHSDSSSHTFRPLGSFVLLMLGYVDSNRSMFGPEASFGDGPESSAAIVLPVIRKVDEGWEIGLFPLCAAVDNSLSMATGRELFGFAKQIGWFSGDLLATSGTVSVETLVFATHQPTTRLARRRWVQVTVLSSDEQSPQLGARAAVDSVLHKLTDVIRSVRSDTYTDTLSALARDSVTSRLSAMMQAIKTQQVSVYNLLQLRDALHPERARIQTVTKSQLIMERLHAVKLLESCQITLSAYDSHPVARDILGLTHQDHVLTPIVSFWITYDARQSQIVEEINLA